MLYQLSYAGVEISPRPSWARGRTKGYFTRVSLGRSPGRGGVGGSLGSSVGTVGATSLSTGTSTTGAGADASNVIFTRTNAYLSGSTLSSAGDVTVTATSTSKIDAIVGAFSAALGAGAVGVGASIGIALARNTIGWTQGAVTADYNSDLIVMGARGAGATLGGYIGSTAMNIVHDGRWACG